MLNALVSSLLLVTCYVSAQVLEPLAPGYYIRPNHDVTLSFATTDNEALFYAASQSQNEDLTTIIKTDGISTKIPITFSLPFDIDKQGNILRGQLRRSYSNAAFFNFEHRDQQNFYVTNITNDGYTTLSCLTNKLRGLNIYISDIASTQNYTLVALRSVDFVLYLIDIHHDMIIQILNTPFSATNKEKVIIHAFTDRFVIIHHGKNQMDLVTYFPSENRYVNRTHSPICEDIKLTSTLLFVCKGQDQYVVRQLKNDTMELELMWYGDSKPIVFPQSDNKFALFADSTLKLCDSYCIVVKQSGNLVTSGTFAPHNKFYFVQNYNGATSLYYIINGVKIYFAAQLRSITSNAVVEHSEIAYIDDRIAIIQKERVNSTSPYSHVALISHIIGENDITIVDTLCDSNCGYENEFLHVLNNNQTVVRKGSNNNYQLYRVQWIPPIVNYTPIIIAGLILCVFAVILVLGAITLQVYFKKRDSNFN